MICSDTYAARESGEKQGLEQGHKGGERVDDIHKQVRELPEVAGNDTVVPVADGSARRIVQLNNAATTPPFRSTIEDVSTFLHRYGALHRGSGPHARATFDLVEDAIRTIRSFIGCGPQHRLLFCENTSAAISLYVRMLDLKSDDVVVISEIEHTSNNLPWRYVSSATVVEVRTFDDGSFDLDHLGSLLSEYGSRIKVVALSGASNQTGYTPDLCEIANRVHEVGAALFADVAQLAAHRQIDMQAQHIDALAFSAHKVYAPFGLGVLALPAAMLEQQPVDPAGGSIDMISDSGVIWAPVEQRHQTGTWNATGIVALGASCRTLGEIGWPTIETHEHELSLQLAYGLAGIDGVRVHAAPESYERRERIGVVPFSINGLHHALVAAILEHEYAIEVRSGTICNHQLVRRWFDVDAQSQESIEQRIRSGDRLASYGIVRASLGIHNTAEDVEALLDAVSEITRTGGRLAYDPVPQHETFEPREDPRPAIEERP